MSDRSLHAESTPSRPPSSSAPSAESRAGQQAERSVDSDEPVRWRRSAAGRRFRLIARWLAAWFVLTAALAAWRHETLHWPPYWDCTIGLWTEANFLAETDFDYHRLRYEEKSVWQGGAKSYVISVLPSLIALGMRSIESTEALLIVAHLISLACAAAILLLVYGLARGVVPRWPAVLVAAAVLTTPLFRVQVDMVGMELPMTALALAAAGCLVRQRFFVAAALAMAAFAMKPTGGLLTLAGIVYAALWWMSIPGRTRLRQTAAATSSAACPPDAAGRAVSATAATADPPAIAPHHDVAENSSTDRRPSTRHAVYAVAIAVLLGTWLVQLAIIRWSGTVETLMRPRYQHRMATLAAAVFWSPDLVILWTITLWVTLRRLRDDLRRTRAALAAGERAQAHLGNLRSRIATLRQVTHRWLAARGLLVLSWIVVTGTLLAIQRISFLPRYLVIAVPFLWLIAVSLAFTSSSGSPRPRRTATLLLACIALNLFNARGALYPDLKTYPGPHLARSGALLERSLEYEADHRANLAALECLMQQAADDPVIVTRPHVDFLAMPRLGYVRRPLHGWVVNNYSDLLADRFRPITSVDPSQLPANPVVVYVDSTWSRLSSVFSMPPPTPNDTVLFRDNGDPPLIVYRKGWSSTSPARQEIDDWYLAHLWPNARPDDRAMYRIAWLFRHARTDDALREARGAVERHPHNFYLRQWLMHLHLHQADLEGAIAAVVTAMPDDPKRTATWYASNTERGYAPPLSAIVPPTTTALKTEPLAWPEAFAPVRHALVLLWQGNVAEAEHWLAARSSGDTAEPLAAVCQACILLEEGFPREALAQLQPMLEDARRSNPAWQNAADRWPALEGTLRHVAARASLHMGNVDRSRKLAQQAVAALADSGITWAEARAWQTLGLAHWRAGHTDEAADCFRRSLAIDPFDRHTQRYLHHLSGETTDNKTTDNTRDHTISNTTGNTVINSNINNNASSNAGSNVNNNACSSAGNIGNNTTSHAARSAAMALREGTRRADTAQAVGGDIGSEP